MAKTILPLPAPDNEEERMSCLEDCVENLFGHLDPDEVDLLAEGYLKATTRMIEIISLRSMGSLVMDLHEDIEFKPVVLPKELMPLLRKHDTFLATIGFDGARWRVLYLSPPYWEGSTEDGQD